MRLLLALSLPLCLLAAPEAPKKKVSAQFYRLPLSIERNDGQVNGQVKYLTRAGNKIVYFLNDHALVSVFEPGDGLRAPGLSSKAKPAGKAATVAMKLERGRAGIVPEAVEALPGIVNYYIGNDPAEWRTNIPTFRQVRYREVYTGVDLLYYGNQGGELEYDFEVAPGADASQIRVRWEGASAVALDANGDLVLRTAAGPLRWRKPAVYQEAANGGRTEIAAGYRIGPDGAVGFAVGAYDRSRKLVIDPTLVFSTFLGGSDSEPFTHLAVAGDGSVYVTGTTYSTNFPTAAPADATLGGLFDGYVLKMNAAGTALVFSTYLGGAATDSSTSIVLDAGLDAYVAGFTGSSNFPVTAGAFQTTYSGGFDAFASKFSGVNGTISYSTYLGGTGEEDALSVVASAGGNLYVAGYTNSSNFPTTVGAFDRTHNGGYDAFVLRLNLTGTIADFSTFFGGSGDELVKFSSFFENRQILDGYYPSVTVDGAGNVYLAGVSSSGNLPTTAGVLHPSYLGGAADGYVAKLNSTASSLLFCTYIGGNGFDAVLPLRLSGSTLLVSGVTSSTNLPTTPGAFETSFNGGPTDIFVQRISDTGVARTYGTYFGTPGQDVGTATLDSANRIYVHGYVSSNLLPTTADAFQPFFGGGIFDAFVSVLDSAGVSLVYSTYFGGTSADQGRAVVDGSDNIFLYGTTVSASFPTTPGSFDTTYNGGNADGFIAKFTPIGTAGGPGSVPTVLPPNGTVNGTLTNTSNLSGVRSNSYSSRYSFVAKAGQQVVITLTSAAFDTYLYLIGPNESIVAENNNGAGGTNSRIPAGSGFFTLTQAGRYVIEVTSNTSFGTGAFTLTITSILPPEKTGVFRFGFFWVQDVDGDRQFTIPPDTAFAFGGAAGDIPISGDWNGDGRTEAGIYRPLNGLFLLDFNGDRQFGAGDRVYNLGVGTHPTDVPVVGDWNGDGRTKVGLFRLGFFWILDTNGNGAFEQGSDSAVAFGGIAGDQPVVGDWDGDGRSNLGLFRLGFFWILDVNGNTQIDNVNQPGGDKAFAFGGLPNDVPITGDWNGDGKTKVGIFRFGFFWVLDANGDTQFTGTGPGQDVAFPFGGLAGDKPLLGWW